MGAGRRHWKEKNGRFYARLAVPRDLIPIVGKGELLEPLGGDRRLADRSHAAAVARLQDKIAQARSLLVEPDSAQMTSRPSVELSEPHLQDATWQHYQDVLRAVEQERKSLPTLVDIEDEYAKYLERLKALEGDGREPEIRRINEGTDTELKKRAKIDKKNQWALRLARLKASFADRSTKLVDDAVLRYVEAKRLRVGHGSKEWEALAHRLVRAEIEALQRAIEQIEGDWTGTVKDPLVAAPFQPLAQTSSADILTLFEAYIASRQRLNKHADGGKRWKPVIDSLVRFLKHSDARKVTRRDLLAWRDHLLKAGKSAKTVADVDLACIRALFRWAHEEDRLPDNPAEGVRQEAPKKIRTRERGYSNEEATRVLNEAMGYAPDQDRTASTRESLHMIAAKRWLPILCAFTGARVTEMAQLRKQDIRRDGDRWIVRISPDAGSVKTGQFRDVPLHRQVIELGFVDFVDKAEEGPLFHGAKDPAKFLPNARVTSGRLSTWLNKMGLVPDGVQPNHGWRHRFKTIGLELDVSERILDAIQGHSGRGASAGYGNVTLTAMAQAIDRFPPYDLKT